MISVEVVVNASIEAVWEAFVSPDAITQWYYASDDWHAPSATNDLRVGGNFLTRMEAKDGSNGFDFVGVYDAVVEHKYISYIIMDNGRRVISPFRTMRHEAVFV